MRHRPLTRYSNRGSAVFPATLAPSSSEFPRMPLVELDRISKAYDQKIAVKDLSLKIDPGTMFGLLGPNGAGKTSSIRMMIGVTLPDSGTVTLFGSPVQPQSAGAGWISAGRARPLQKDEGHRSAGLLRPVARPRRDDGQHPRSPVGGAAADRGRPRQEDRRALEGHAAEDPVHRHAAARS